MIRVAQADRMAQAQAVVQAEREAVRACEAEVSALTAQLTEAQRKLAEKTASLGVAERLVAIFSPTNDTSSAASKAAPKRRMRLGAKKRAIYTLVAKQVCTIEQIETHLTVLHETDIDRRYIRDVVRDAISDGDMQGEIDQQFIISEAGREILEKAPVPDEYEAYRDAAEMRQAMRGLPSAAAQPSPPFPMPAPVAGNVNPAPAGAGEAETGSASGTPGFPNPNQWPRSQ
ncbi:MAG: hypothetical protein AAF281_04900 [Pseudomonadota bacterium]